MFRLRAFACFVVGVAVLAATFVAAQTGSSLLNQARARKAAGDLQAATEAFEKIVTDFSTSDRSSAAKALLELGEIFESLGQAARSKSYYERARNEFKDQPAEAALAGNRLSAAGGAAGSTPTKIQIRTPNGDDVYAFAISPDGRTLVYQGTSPEGQRQLWRQAVDASQKPEPIAGTEGAGSGAFPFFSPDGKTIGFFAKQKLLQVPLAGGTPKEVADAPAPWGADWKGDSIVQSVRGLGGPLELMEGRQIRALTTAPGLYMWPKFAGDRHVLYMSRDQRGTGALQVGALDGSPGFQARGVTNVHAGAYSQGYLIYATANGTLNAIRFDADQGAASGQAILLSDRVGREDRLYGVAAFSASAAGPVAYRETATLKKQMMWLDRDGGLLGTIGAPDTATPGNPRISPDGRTIIHWRQLVTPAGTTWLMDAQTGGLQQFPDLTSAAVWSPTGDRFLFSTPVQPGIDNTRVALFERPAGGNRGGARKQIGPVQALVAPEDWAQNGTVLFRTGQNNGTDLFAIPPGQNDPVAVAQSPAEDRFGRFSPDSNWIAYQSNESGRHEVYVQPFPGTMAQRQRVSLSGGKMPQWGRKGRELYFLADDNRLMVVAVESAVNDGKTAVTFGIPKPLFKSPLPPGSEFTTTDGDRFLIIATVDEYPPITVISNWMPGK